MSHLLIYTSVLFWKVKVLEDNNFSFGSRASSSSSSLAGRLLPLMGLTADPQCSIVKGASCSCRKGSIWFCLCVCDVRGCVCNKLNQSSREKWKKGEIKEGVYIEVELHFDSDFHFTTFNFESKTKLNKSWTFDLVCIVCSAFQCSRIEFLVLYGRVPTVCLILVCV